MDRTVRGLTITLTQELFDEIIAKGLGLNPGEIEVWHVANHRYNRAFELTIQAQKDDTRFPIVLEGAKVPEGSLTVYRREDGTLEVREIVTNA